MAKDVNAAGFRALVDIGIFTKHFKRSCAAIETRLDVLAQYDEDAITQAYWEWINLYYDLICKKRSRRGRVSIVIAYLIQATCRAGLVQFSEKPTDNENIINRATRVLLRFQSEIAALAFGAMIYSLEIQRRTGQDPSCPLTHSDMERAAAKLRTDPRKALGFRSLLKLRDVGGGGSGRMRFPLVVQERRHSDDDWGSQTEED